MDVARFYFARMTWLVGSWSGLFAINTAVHWNWTQISGPLLGMDPRNSRPHILCLSKPQFVTNDTYPQPDQIYLLEQKRTTLFYSHWIMVRHLKHPLCYSLPFYVTFIFRFWVFVISKWFWRSLELTCSLAFPENVFGWRMQCSGSSYQHFWPPNLTSFYHQFKANYQIQ